MRYRLTEKRGFPVKVTEHRSKCGRRVYKIGSMHEMHGDKSIAGKVDETQVTKDSNSQLIYLDFFHELNEELLKVLN